MSEEQQLDLLCQDILAAAEEVFARLADLDDDARIDVINALRARLSEHSPMRGEPVDCVQWVRAEKVQANDYNPNIVAPPEMKLLEKSITDDGYTQPIVGWPIADGHIEVVDGFHRHRVGKESKKVAKRVRGRLPVALIQPERSERSDRMAATIRHNRARGVHTVDGMSEIVLDLARRGKTDAWIGEHLGMDADEVLRLRQTQGLAELFADEEFSEAWEVSYDPEATGVQVPDSPAGLDDPFTGPDDPQGDGR
ncbi:IbrB-like domain-containing protein [Marinactinospora rubrisoli]|uniref:IbrB-like domain-containing protein n=1 Tax=Marinactinospora rubrisoli TaxID=2715399 RepID=A0ABW2KPR2_9ACTN